MPKKLSETILSFRHGVEEAADELGADQFLVIARNSDNGDTHAWGTGNWPPSDALAALLQVHRDLREAFATQKGQQ